MTEKRTSEFLKSFFVAPDPYDFGPPGPGSGYVIICTDIQFTHPSFHRNAKQSKKSLKMDVNVPSKSNKQSHKTH
jgi:hypothetical protein